MGVGRIQRSQGENKIGRSVQEEFKKRAMIPTIEIIALEGGWD